jgi:outer membrane protein assembly factor BamE (lipoprotein component of BamABCDE complex)
MRAGSEKADFVRHMAEIEGSIRVGMLASDVIHALGEPLLWQTNADGVFADYWFQPPTGSFDVLTNGLKITFSNGVVVGKAPNTVLSNGRRND